MGGARGEELVAYRGVGSAGPFRGRMRGAQPCPGGCGPIGQVWPYPGGPGLTGQRALSGSSALRGPMLLTPSPPLGPGGAAAPAPSLALDLGAGVDQVSFTQIPWAWAQEGGAWFCDLDIPTFLKLSEEAASGLQCMERSGRGLAGNELPCCRDGNGITAAGGISVRGGGPSMPTLSQVRVGVPGMLVRLALSGTPAHQSCSCGSPAVPGPAQRAQLRASTDQAPPWGRAVSHP